MDTNTDFLSLVQDQGFEAVEGNSLDIDKLEEAGMGESDTVISVTSSNRVNLMASRLAKVDFEIKDAFPLFNNHYGDLGEKAVARLGLDVAFGKTLDFDEVNSKLEQGTYKIIECELDSSFTGKEVEELCFPNELIPILLFRGKSSKIPIICRSGISFEQGNRLIILDLNGTTDVLEHFGFMKYKQLDI